MIIVFLDMDGVVVTKGWSWERYNQRPDLYHMEPPADPKAIRNLNKLADSSSMIRFVLSSSWRTLHSKQDILDYLLNAKFNGVFHDDWCTPATKTGFRGDDIREWVQNQRSVITAFICLDDEDDFYPEQNLIKTNRQYGFTKENLSQAMDSLDTQLKGKRPAVASQVIQVERLTS